MKSISQSVHRIRNKLAWKAFFDVRDPVSQRRLRHDKPTALFSDYGPMPPALSAWSNVLKQRLFE